MFKKRNLLMTITVMLLLCVTALLGGCAGLGNPNENNPSGNDTTPPVDTETGTYYTLTFDTNGGSTIEPIKLKEDADIILPENPTKTGYSFAGWFIDEWCDSENTLVKMPDWDVTLYANWEINSYTITFETNGGSEIQPITKEYNSNIYAPTNPTKNDFVFNGWYTDNNFTTKFDFDKMPSENITLYAKWSEKAYTIYYELNKGVNNVDNPKSFLKDDEMITLKEPTKETNIFMGWYTDEEFTNKVTQIDPSTASDVTLYAKWLEYLIFKYDYNYDFVVEFNPDAKGLIEDIVIPEGKVNYIGAGAFYNSNIKSITIPKSIIKIKDNAFKGCDKLEKINISSIKDWSNITFETKFSNPLYKGEYYDAGKASDRWLYLDNKPVTEITFTNEISYIQDNAFYGYDKLTKITFADGVTVNKNAFSECKNLTTIDMTKDTKSVHFGIGCFKKCTSLTNVNLSGISSNTINDELFYDCKSLQKIVIPDIVTAIGNDAFRGCEKLSDITFGPNLMYINDRAFRGCNFNEVVVPSTVKRIGAGAYSGCNMTSIILPSGLETIGDDAFSSNYLKSIIIPKSVVTVGEFILDRNSTTGGEPDKAVKIYCEIKNSDQWGQPNGWNKMWRAYYDKTKNPDFPYSYYYELEWGYVAQ